MKRDVIFQAVTERCEIPQGWIWTHLDRGKAMAVAGYLQEGAKLEHPTESQIFRC